MQPSTSSEEQQLDDWLAPTDTSQLTSPYNPHEDSALLFQDSMTPHKPPASPLLRVKEAQESVCSAAAEESVTESEGGAGFFRQGNAASQSTDAGASCCLTMHCFSL